MSRSPVRAMPALLLLSLIACGGAASPPSAPAPQTAPAATPNTAELEALYHARTDSAAAQYTEADVQFMTGMIGHHAQALVMSKMAATHGASPEVQRLASRIINSQTDEIRTMQTWLRDRGHPAPEVMIEGTEVMLHGGGAHAMHSMPGMLTPEQMADLDAARGAEFDRRFLTYMIQHHSGALAMVDELFAQPGAAEETLAFKIASDAQADQRTEIARMKSMLASLQDDGAKPQP